MLKKFPDGQNHVFIMASQSKGHIHKFQYVEQIKPRAAALGFLFGALEAAEGYVRLLAAL